MVENAKCVNDFELFGQKRKMFTPIFAELLEDLQ